MAVKQTFVRGDRPCSTTTTEGKAAWFTRGNRPVPNLSDVSETMRLLRADPRKDILDVW